MKPLTPEMQAVPPLMMKARRKTEAACEAEAAPRPGLPD